MNPDVIISGAGPAGLACAIFCARSGLSVLVLEKADRPGPEPRGETARPHEIFEDLLGKDFMSSISLHRTSARRFNSPGAEKSFEIQRKHSSYIFDWHVFIARLFEEALKAGVKFSMGTSVAGAIIENGICRGVVTANGEELMAHTILDCMGHTSVLGKKAGIDYRRLNNPMIKSLISNFKGEYRGMEFFFIPAGSLHYAPSFPPCLTFIFPRNDDKCEIGLMIMSGPAAKLGLRLPDSAEQLRVWHELKSGYPRFSGQIKGSRVDYEGLTCLTMAGLQPEGVIIPGLIHLGDAIGFVEASGGCGLASSLQNARFAADFAACNRAHAWNAERQDAYNRSFRASLIYRHIRKVYRLVLPALNFIFARLKTPGRVNRHWWLVKLFYKLG
ncbi:MAG TPA: NAD(P)/FAD-dependent oxidoreductase [Smithella sp.]|nr:NAD(P)/FAD-dependent oxidoreductase [Smithella sp.]